MEELTALRRVIDDLDVMIIKLLKTRLQVALEIAKSKKSQGLPLTDTKRETEVLSRIRELAESEHLNSEMVVEIFQKIITLSKHEQKLFWEQL